MSEVRYIYGLRGSGRTTKLLIEGFKHPRSIFISPNDRQSGWTYDSDVANLAYGEAQPDPEWEYLFITENAVMRGDLRGRRVPFIGIDNLDMFKQPDFVVDQAMYSAEFVLCVKDDIW